MKKPKEDIMQRNYTRVLFSLVAVAALTWSLTGCFKNPTDPHYIGGGGYHDDDDVVVINAGDTSTTGITAASSQATSQGVYLSVQDQNGNPITASYFTGQNFQITYNGALIPSGSITVTTAGGSGRSISSSLVLDYSDSMGSQDIVDMENASAIFVNNMQAADRGAIIKFGSYVYREQAYTSTKSLLITAITGTTSASGATALYDAIYMGLTDTALESGQRAVVAFTDGYENNSTYMQSDIVGYAQSQGIPIYTIGLGYADSASLQTIATQTNGQYYEAPDSTQLAAIYQQIARIFTNTLIISWPSFVYQSGAVVSITITYSCATGTYTSMVIITLP